MADTIWRHYAEPHWPRFYRYRVAEDAAGYRLARNVYPCAPAQPGIPETRGSAWIGLALNLGRYAYCVKWAHARLRQEASRG